MNATKAIKPPLPVQCIFCRKLFTLGGSMTCGAKAPGTGLPNGAWCKTDDIVKMLENPQ